VNFPPGKPQWGFACPNDAISASGRPRDFCGETRDGGIYEGCWRTRAGPVRIPDLVQTVVRLFPLPALT
jgi:hypothetical protein